jgi:hypothetical protein
VKDVPGLKTVVCYVSKRDDIERMVAASVEALGGARCAGEQRRYLGADGARRGRGPIMLLPVICSLRRVGYLCLRDILRGGLMHGRNFCSNQSDAEAIHTLVISHLDFDAALLAEPRDIIEQLV